MNKHALKTHKTFNSSIEKKVIIGGETDFCAERFGYIREKNGISPAPTHRQTTTQIALYDIRFTECMPMGVRAVFVGGDGKLYSYRYTTTYSTTTESTLTTQYPSVHSSIVDGAYCCVVVSGNKVALMSPTVRTRVMTIPVQLKSSVMHCGRLFGVDATDEYMLRWSGYSFLDWDEGVDGSGNVRFTQKLGKLLNLFVLGEKIVILREKGITTLTTLGDSRHMRADICDKHGLPPVYENSSVICRGQLWIYTKNGIYVYDGSTLSEAPFEKIMSGYVLSHPKVVDDRYIYYSALKDGVKCLFMYDTMTGAGNPFCKKCHDAFFTEIGGFAFNGSYLGTLEADLDDPNRVWVSEPFTFDEDRPAVLKSLIIEGSGNFTVETDCDGRKLYAVGAGKYRYAESGQSFVFTVTGNGCITSMTAEWEVRK